MRKLLSLLLSIAILASVCTGIELTAAAAEVPVTAESTGASYSPNECGNNLKWTLSNGTLTISGTGNMYDFAAYQSPWENNSSEIKSIIIQNGVTSIGNCAFYSCYNLTNVKIADSVLKIGSSAFTYCDSLTEISISSNVTDIGDSAFYSCGSLTNINVDSGNKNYSSNNGVLFNKDKTEIIAYPDGKTATFYTIPDGVTKICHGAITNKNLTGISISGSVTDIGDSPFNYCRNLENIYVDYTNNNYSSSDGVLFNKSKTELIKYPRAKTSESYTIPSKVTQINDDAFEDCSNLTNVIIGDGVTNIGNSAFSSCDELLSVTIGKNVETISDYAFWYCEKLSGIDLTDSVTSIGECAFANCDLTYVNIGSGTVRIGFEAFSGNNRLTDITVDGSNKYYYSSGGVLFDKNKALITYPIGKNQSSYTIPNGTTAIGYSAFYKCKNLTAVVIPDSVTSIDDFAFYDCENLTGQTFGSNVKDIGNSAFYGCTALTNLKLSTALTRIGSYAFAECGFTNITIPSEVISIGYAPFLKCANLTAVSVSSDNNSFIAKDGVLFDKDMTVLIQYPAGKTNTSYSIPDGVTDIGVASFKYCLNLNNVEIPDSTTNIGYKAFEFCESLKKVTIPDHVTHIGNNAFSACFSLTSATVGSRVINIDWAAFSYCNSLKEIYFKGNAPQIENPYGSDLFSNITATAYFPAGDSTWTSDILKNYGGTITWKTWSTAVSQKSNISKCAVTLSDTSYTYDGSTKKPSVTIKDGIMTLQIGTDYSVAYSNNTNAGTATVTITGIGNYTGNVTKSFTIKKASQNVTASISPSIIKVGSTATIKASGIGTITYSSSNTGCASVSSSGVVTAKSAGTATIAVSASGNNNYNSASKSITVTVNNSSSSKVTLDSLTYSFSNSRSGFNYPSDYRIPLNIYKIFFSDQTAQAYYNSHTSWGGNCFGMATTSGMFNTSGSTLVVSDFNSSAKKVSDLKINDKNTSLGLTVTQLNEAMLVSQFTPEIQNTFRDNRNDIDGLCKEIKKVENGSAPVAVGIMGVSSGHELLGYKIEKVNSTTSYLHVYDCNYPNQDKYIKLTTNSSGAYTGEWYYSDKYNSAVGSIDYTTYDVYQAVWENRKTNTKNETNTLFVNSDSFEIQDYQGNTIASMENGEFYSSEDDIYEAISYDIETDEHMIYMPTDIYTIINTDTKDTPELEVSMVNVDQSVSVTTQADCVELLVDDQQSTNLASINGLSGDTYEVTLNSSLKLAEDRNTVEYSGRCRGDSVTVGTSFGELLASNYSASGITVKNSAVNFSYEDDKDISENCEATLDSSLLYYDGTKKEPSVTVTETESGKTLVNGADYLVVYNNNTDAGTAVAAIYGINHYKGKITMDFVINNAVSPTKLGDSNGDGKVSVLDATEIQKYLVDRATFNDVQKSVSDVNGDGKISVLDATEIQKYLAGLPSTLV